MRVFGGGRPGAVHPVLLDGRYDKLMAQQKEGGNFMGILIALAVIVYLPLAVIFKLTDRFK